MITDYQKKLIDSSLQTYSMQIRKKQLTPNDIHFFNITRGYLIEEILNKAELEIISIIKKFMEELK